MLRSIGFIDSNYAGCPNDKSNIGSYGVFFGNNLVSWMSSKQKNVSRSSAELEYRTLALATSELIWLQSVLMELRIFETRLLILFTENISAKYLAANPIMHATN